MSLNFLPPEVMAKTKLGRWETSQNVSLDEADRILILSLMARIFSQEDLSHLQPELVSQEPLFNADEIKQINEVAEKYPAIAAAILEFFANYLPLTETEVEE